MNFPAAPVLAEPTHTADGSSATQDGGEVRESTTQSCNDPLKTVGSTPGDSRGGGEML